MKLMSFEHQGTSSFGIAMEDKVADIGTMLSRCATDLKALVGRDDLLAVCERFLPDATHIPLDKVTFLPPIGNPDKIICVGLNYEDHRIETNRPVTKHPTLFSRFANTQCGHQAPMFLPQCSEKLDFEAELAVIIGRRGRNISRTDALGHISGYACYNDGSVRDWQRHSSQFLPGKNFPGTGAFGPYIVTADEISDPHNLKISCRLNGKDVQSSHTSQMIFKLDELIHYISTFTELMPGDLIVTGTPGGVGVARTPPLYMKDGDEVEVDIEHIGVLKNTVRPPQ